jgi:hypothetical protein
LTHRKEDKEGIEGQEQKNDTKYSTSLAGKERRQLILINRIVNIKKMRILLVVVLQLVAEFR